MSTARSDLFTRLFVEYRAALRRYARRLVGSPAVAEEIVQETFLRAYAHPDELHSARAFLFTTTHNLSAKWLRHRRVAATDTIGDTDELGVQDDHSRLEEQLIAEEELDLLRQAVAQLTPQCRAAFALRVFHQQSYREIAQSLGISAKTVENHVSRGIRATHAYLRLRYAPRAAVRAAGPQAQHGHGQG